ncbi:Na+/H+ antiporter subunit E [Halopseudomonas salegens]|uniref:Multicomponent Na+:H+ antiporter subunit E n=1 Tax=Halopseudomonas salegens TaxID=1434072 RepID=A0A1H2FZW9_9GAMM|nr:Na+/H+ antiporter subunit E [Halopseudomonas salegens]SDU12887.1 multicomponent Na+:H+ antiporter subunit E [Halopseudomonas salegens]
MLVLHLLGATVLAWWLDDLSATSWFLALAAGYPLFRVLGVLLPVCRLYARRIEVGTVFVLWYTWKVVAATLDVALIVLNPRRQVSSAVVKVPIKTRDRRLVTIIGCLLTLTPGTLALDYNEYDGDLYVHILDTASADPVFSAVAEIEQRLMAWVYPGGEA